MKAFLNFSRKYQLRYKAIDKIERETGSTNYQQFFREVKKYMGRFHTTDHYAKKPTHNRQRRTSATLETIPRTPLNIDMTNTRRGKLNQSAEEYVQWPRLEKPINQSKNNRLSGGDSGVHKIWRKTATYGYTSKRNPYQRSKTRVPSSPLTRKETG